MHLGNRVKSSVILSRKVESRTIVFILATIIEKKVVKTKTSFLTIKIIDI